jgi:hypothetical protein
MAKKAQDHGQKMRETALNSEINYRNLTIWLGLLVILIMIVGAVICAVTGHDNVGIAIGGAAGLAAAAGVFVKGRDLFNGNGNGTGKKEATEAKPTPAKSKQNGKQSKRRR